MSNSQEPGEARHTQDPIPGQTSEGGRSGEGAASAMQQLMTQQQRHRRHRPEADDSAHGGNT